MRIHVKGDCTYTLTQMKVENRHDQTHTVDEGTIASKVQVLFVRENINTLLQNQSQNPLG